MQFNGRGGVSVAEIIVYVPCAILGGYITYKHGFGKNSGWIYTIVLCLLRIAGSICQLLTYNNPNNTNIFTAEFVLDSIGVSPLLLATLGLLSRLADQINASSSSVNCILQHRVFRLLQLVFSVGAILGIVGGTSINFNANGTFTMPVETKVCVILYIIGYVGVMALLVVCLTNSSCVPWKERRLGFVVAWAAPFILLRLIYSILCTFHNDSTFNLYNGSLGALVGMSVVEELVVVVSYIILGFNLDKLQDYQKGPIQSGGKVRAMQGSRRPPQAEDYA